MSRLTQATPLPLALIATALLLTATAIGCAPERPPPTHLDEVLGLVRQTFEEGDATHLDPLYPDGWALVALAGEPRRSVTGPEMRRRLARLFRNRAPVAYEERPRSIRRSTDGGHILLISQWTSMAIGTDRLVVERIRIGLEQTQPEPTTGERTDGTSPTPSTPTWHIRELTTWTE